MTTQYTPTLKLALPVTGELSGTWGDTVNDNITSMIEQAIAGLSTINTWTANAHTLTTANGTTSESRCAMLVAATGGGAPTAAADIICPAAAKLYVLQNNTSFAVTLKTSAGTGVAVAAGDTAFLFCDATNVNSCVTTIVNGNITGNLTVGGNATINGNTTLGNATSDTITATARFNTDLVPSTDNARDLGSAANSWKDLFIDGTATMALVAISGGTINGVSIGATTAATLINVDNLRLDGNTLSSTDTNGNVVIAPNGTGDVQLDADTVRVGDAAAAATLTSNGAGALTVTTGGAADLTLSTNSGTTSGTVVIANGANGNITLTPDGTGDVILSADRVQMGDSNTDTTLTTNGTGSLNLTTNNGTNSGTVQIAQGVNGNITLTPNGTGSVSISKLYSSGNTILGATSANTLSVAATITSNLLFTDATYDIGASGATRPRDLFLSRNLTVGGTLTLTGGVNLNGNVTVGDSSADTLTINSTITSNLIFTDNTYDIGASGATRPRTLYLGTSLITPAITNSGLTSGRVTYAGTGGLLQDSANLTFSGSALAVTGTLSATGTVSGTQYTSTSSSVSLPAFNVTGSGIYNNGTNTLGVSCNSANVANFSATGLAVTGAVSTGLYSVPSTNVGIARQASTDALEIKGTGTYIARFNNDTSTTLGGNLQVNGVATLLKAAGLNTVTELLVLDADSTTHVGGKGSKITFKDISVYDNGATIEQARIGVSTGSTLSFRLRNAATAQMILTDTLTGSISLAINGTITAAGQVNGTRFNAASSTAVDTASTFGYNSTQGTYIFSNTGSARIFSLYNGSGGEQYVIGTDYSHVWYTNTASRMILNSSGNLVINNSGTTLDSALLTINCTAGTGSTIPLSLRAGVTADGYGMVNFRNQAGIQGSMACNTGSISMSGLSGLTFVATQVASAGANTLDDYEEGTWTPTYVTSGTGFTSITYNTTFTGGQYVKIGQQVFLTGYLRTEAITIGAASGTMSIGGLPFPVGTSGASTYYRTQSTISGTSFASNAPVQANPSEGLSSAYLLYLQAIGSATALSGLSFADMATGANSNIIQIGITYLTTT